jgi:hypothetical protein
VLASVVLADGHEHSVTAIRAELADHISWTPEDLAAQMLDLGSEVVAKL